MLIFMRGLARLEDGVAVIAYILTAVLLASEIVAREVFGTTLLGSGIYAILSSATAGFLGFALATRASSHLRISAFDGFVPERWRASHARFADLLAACIFLGFAFFAGQYVAESFEFNDRVAVIMIPRWPFQMVMVYAFVSSALWHFTFFMHPDERLLYGTTGPEGHSA